MQINMWLYLSTCLWGISLCLRLVQKKNRPEKFGFVVTPNLNILAVRWSVKYFFTPNSPIFRQVQQKNNNEIGNYKVLRFANKRKKRSQFE